MTGSFFITVCNVFWGILIKILKGSCHSKKCNGLACTTWSLDHQNVNCVCSYDFYIREALKNSEILSHFKPFETIFFFR